MFVDWRGQPVTASSASTVQGIDAFAVNFLAYENGAGEVLKAADADPDCALANAYAAMLMMFMEQADAPVRAKPVSGAGATGGRPRQ